MAPPPRPVAEVVWKVHRALYTKTRGRIGHHFLGMTTLLLTTKGRKTGQQRSTALMYLEDGPGLAVVASNLGSDKPPAWWLNLKAMPAAEIRIGPERRVVRGRETTDDERERLWPRFVDLYPDYAEYERMTDRRIPIVMLEPA
ncbi:nitroreductase/quinone reductase family protein [Conexibacter sp. SYSU D00693]|uniref:nitroreductase/quinone reductase family protein n=1 Tax=Conexibacter sp. SYSU D00693 TaxID=2812560 RepID=UPI00196A633A|nr:nitroreductase/quinone reductase family protein [Conexibacter sp. SYSU D00693]